MTPTVCTYVDTLYVHHSSAPLHNFGTACRGAMRLLQARDTPEHSLTVRDDSTVQYSVPLFTTAQVEAH